MKLSLHIVGLLIIMKQMVLFLALKEQMEKDVEEVSRTALKVKASVEALDRDVCPPVNWLDISLQVLFFFLLNMG